MAAATKERTRGRDRRPDLEPEQVGSILGLYEIGVLLGVDDRTPHTWKYRDQLPPPDYPSINHLEAWDRQTIIAWAARTNRLPEELAAEAGNRKVKARIAEFTEMGFGPDGQTPATGGMTPAQVRAAEKPNGRGKAKAGAAK